MPSSQGIQILHQSSVNKTLGALASLGAVAVDDEEYGSAIAAGFLMKKIEGFFMVNGAAPALQNDDIGLLCLVYGDISVTELAALMIVEQPDPAVDRLLDQAQVRGLVIARGPDFIVQNENDANPADITLTWDLSKFVLPGKGMPFPEGQGWHWQYFNPTGSAFTTGGVGDLWVRYKGVWLSD